MMPTPATKPVADTISAPPTESPAPAPAPGDWWTQAFPLAPYLPRTAPGAKQMLFLVAYDIAEPRRLARVARLCEDHGVRVQYSLFECRLTEERFERFWAELEATIERAEDRLVAYRLDARCARETRTAGTMVCPEHQVVCYLV